MANTYTQVVGSIEYKKRTPVLKAFFSNYEFLPLPGRGNQAIVGYQDDVSWDDVYDNLESLCLNMKLKIADDDDVPVVRCLSALAAYFKVEGDTDLQNFLEHFDSDDSPSLQVIFFLAKKFDDGHGLSKMVIESSWHCDKLRLGEFGGSAQSYNPNLSLCMDTHRCVTFAEELEQLCANHDVAEAATSVVVFLKNMLTFESDEMRAAVMQEVARRLLANEQPVVTK